MFFEDDSVGEDDLKNDRVFVLSTGNNVHVVKKGPYDMWEIHYEHGELPSELKGQWTSFQMAKVAIEKYFHRQKIDIDEVIT